MSAVALMDARSIAATAANGGILTSAETLDCWGDVPEYTFDKTVYEKRVYYGYQKGDEEKSLIYGPNIKDWPEMSPLTDNILLKVCSKILDPVTTTDELIPSGETSSFRSNPLGLAEFTLSRRDPEYVGRSKEVDKIEKARVAGKDVTAVESELKDIFDKIRQIPGQENVENAATEIGSNVMNWGMLPFQMKAEPEFEVGDYIYVPDVKAALDGDMQDIKAYVIGDEIKEISLYIAPMTANEKKIVKAGCLINYNRSR